VRAPQIEDAVAVLARLMADDLRVRPAAVTAPMIRLVARLAPPDHESDLANECFGCEEYLDCDCARVDPQFESRRQSTQPEIWTFCVLEQRSPVPIVSDPESALGSVRLDCALGFRYLW
jgi:hypothetical protein